MDLSASAQVNIDLCRSRYTHTPLPSLLLAFILAAYCVYINSTPQALAKRHSEFTGPGGNFKPDPVKPIYSLEDAVSTAIKNYPTLRYAQAKIKSQAAGITLAKTAYLPNFDVMTQELRTTTNVVAGTILPQEIDVIPMQSGVATHSSSFKTVFASNAGAQFSWMLWDFGLRHSNVLLARASEKQAQANLRLTALDVGYTCADKYLSTIAANEVIKAQEATVRRMEAWALIVHTLVDQGMRPGVDAYRADSDLAMAKIALIDAQNSAQLLRVDLAESMGIAGQTVNIIPDYFVKKPTELFKPAPTNIIIDHPLAKLRAQDVDVAKAKVYVLNRTWYPHLWLRSGIWGRGSGLRSDPRVAAAGTLPQTGNYSVGFTIGFPFFDYFEIKARTRMQKSDEQAQRANYDLAWQVLTQKDARAKVMLDNARKIADETPILLNAAKENEMKALERYKVGLTDIVEIAEAERILAKAEVEDAVAEVRVWEAILATSYAQGDLKPFLDLVKAARGGN